MSDNVSIYIVLAQDADKRWRTQYRGPDEDTAWRVFDQACLAAPTYHCGIAVIENAGGPLPRQRILEHTDTRYLKHIDDTRLNGWLHTQG